MLPIRNNFKHEYTKRLKVKGQKKIYHAKEKKKSWSDYINIRQS